MKVMQWDIQHSIKSRNTISGKNLLNTQARVHFWLLLWCYDIKLIC